MIRRLCLALAASTAICTAALAQSMIPAPAVHFIAVPADAILSYNLVGLNVYNSARENVGEIKDIVIAKDMLDGYILSVGGFLGVGQRYVAVKPDAVAKRDRPCFGVSFVSLARGDDQDFIPNPRYRIPAAADVEGRSP